MAFNHYAKIKQILTRIPDGWYVKRINKATSAQNFKGEKINYTHYYRIYTANHESVKFCKFQQLDRFANMLDIDIENITIHE